MRVQRAMLSLALALAGACGPGPTDEPTPQEPVTEPTQQPPQQQPPTGDGILRVDASGFPREYRGVEGSLTGQRAYAGGQPVGYYGFSFSSAQLQGKDPLAVRDGYQPTEEVPTPTGYVFEDPASAPCPAQLPIFTALPTSTYVPVITQVPARTSGEPCQELRGEQTLLENQGASLPDGTFRAWAVIDPAAAVYRYTSTSGTKNPATGVGLQSWGWYEERLLAYLDGGVIPTQEVTHNGVPVVRMVAQKLYHPRQVREGANVVEVKRGQGYDVLETRRGAAGYSPVCQVFTYEATDGAGAPLPGDQLPRSAGEVVSRYGATLRTPSEGDAYAYCLQLE